MKEKEPEEKNLSSITDQSVCKNNENEKRDFILNKEKEIKSIIKTLFNKNLPIEKYLSLWIQQFGWSPEEIFRHSLFISLIKNLIKTLIYEYKKNKDLIAYFSEKNTLCQESGFVYFYTSPTCYELEDTFFEDSFEDFFDIFFPFLKILTMPFKNLTFLKEKNQFLAFAQS